MSKMIPIFIITCERLEVLKKSIQSYHDCIKTPFEIIIIDFGSTYKPTIEFLKNLEREKTKVYWKARIKHPKGLNRIDRNIQDYFKTHPGSNYVVTDPDIALDNVDGDIFNVYSYLLNAMPEIEVVGPMLRIDDIPDYYRNKKIVESRHYKNFWSKERNYIQYKNKTIEYIHSKHIDTTFAMNRAWTRWRRLKLCIRTLSPYLAKHLDWYLDLDNPTPDQKHYIEYASSAISNWSNLKQRPA